MMWGGIDPLFPIEDGDLEESREESMSCPSEKQSRKMELERAK